MELAFCVKCGKEQPVKWVEVEEKHKVLGEEFFAKTKMSVCADCGEPVWHEPTEIANQKIVFDLYRKKMNLLLPEEIIEIRQKYGLSAQNFSRLLGFGDKTVTRYENGSIQDKSHDLLMRLMKNEWLFHQVWENQKKKFSPSENQKVECRLARSRPPVVKASSSLEGDYSAFYSDDIGDRYSTYDPNSINPKFTQGKENRQCPTHACSI